MESWPLERGMTLNKLDKINEDGLDAQEKEDLRDEYDDETMDPRVKAAGQAGARIREGQRRSSNPYGGAFAKGLGPRGQVVSVKNKHSFAQTQQVTFIPSTPRFHSCTSEQRLPNGLSSSLNPREDHFVTLHIAFLQDGQERLLGSTPTSSASRRALARTLDRCNSASSPSSASAPVLP